MKLEFYFAPEEMCSRKYRSHVINSQNSLRNLDNETVPSLIVNNLIISMRYTSVYDNKECIILVRNIHNNINNPVMNGTFPLGQCL